MGVLGRKKKPTTSSVVDEVEAQVVAAVQSVMAVVVSPTVVKEKPVQEPKKMSTEELPSIVEYSEDIATAEAPPPLPVGEYPAQIKSATVKESQKGSKYYEVMFYLSPNEYPADFDKGDPDGMQLAYRRLSAEDKPQARFNMRKFCEAIGATASKRIDVNDWIGLEGKIQVVHETYEGVQRAQVKGVIGL